VQIALDLIALTTLLHFAGGVENPFALFFVFHMIIASILLSPTASFLAALLASSLFAAMALLEYRGLIPHYNLVGLINSDLYRRGTYVGATILVMTITLFLVVYMASSISARLRTRTTELLEVSRSHEAKSQEQSPMSCGLQWPLSTVAWTWFWGAMPRGRKNGRFWNGPNGVPPNSWIW
jgi:hypothetical protein